ncbi:60S ribosome biogenesis protein Rrp14-domain-containing protein [Tuber brumale]|nr:60S ribosome biogenesis protein Rrp14-domain-containing protein [Tuber brumale]
MVTAKPIAISVSAIEDRLQLHSREFTSLLELIPAKYYYGNGDNTSQWKKRKQTKAQSVIAKRARLDPDAPGVGLESEPKPTGGREKFENKSERRKRKEKKSSATIAATGEDGGDEDDDDQGIEEEAQGIALDNLTFATELDASSPLPTFSASDRKYVITTTATGPGGAATAAAARKAGQRTRLAAKIQGLERKLGGYPPSATTATTSTNKSSRRKNAEAKRSKKDQRRQRTVQLS